MKNGLVKALSISMIVLYRRRRMLPLLLITCAAGLFFGELSNKFSDLPRLRNRNDIQLWEEPTLLKMNFSWISKIEDRCKLNDTNKDLHVLPILVHSQPYNFRERLSIRKTWGSVDLYRNWTTRVVFLLGQDDSSKSKFIVQEKLDKNARKLKEEQNRFGDIVIGNFIDSYRNLSYKHMMGYKWVLNFCREAEFVVKTDDDVFINTFEWLDWRIEDLSKIGRTEKDKVPDLHCMRFEKGTNPPVRNMSHPYKRWLVTFDEWPETDYPDYCSGWAYGLTMDLVEKIYNVSNDRKMFWIDDIFVTGALMELAMKKYNFQLETRELSWGDTVPTDKDYVPSCVNGEFNKTSIRKVHHLTSIDRNFVESDMTCLWNKALHDQRRNKGH